jgi:hypothetical protein
VILKLQSRRISHSLKIDAKKSRHMGDLDGMTSS